MVGCSLYIFIDRCTDDRHTDLLVEHKASVAVISPVIRIQHDSLDSVLLGDHSSCRRHREISEDVVCTDLLRSALVGEMEDFADVKVHIRVDGSRGEQGLCHFQRNPDSCVLFHHDFFDCIDTFRQSHLEFKVVEFRTEGLCDCDRDIKYGHRRVNGNLVIVSVFLRNHKTVRDGHEGLLVVHGFHIHFKILRIKCILIHFRSI